MSSVTIGTRNRTEVAISAADLPANTTQNFLSPDDGFLQELAVIVQSAVTTGGTIKVQNGSGLDVGGLAVTIPNGAAAGSVYRATATKGDTNRPCKKNDACKLVPAGFATAGSVRAVVGTSSNDSPQMPY